MTVTHRTRASAASVVAVDRPDLPWASDWQAHAAGATRTDLPWLTDAAHVTAWQAAAMRAVCDACPVVLDCLAAVDALDVTGGWWAGADRDPDTLALAVPAWAVAEPGDHEAQDGAAVLTVWVPVRSRRAGPILGEQLALRLA